MTLAALIRRLAGPAVASLGALAALAPPAGAQPTLIFALRNGDTIPGVGDVKTLGACAVNSAGDWIISAKTDQANPATDEVLMRSGTVYLREGDALASPAGASVDGFGPFDLDDSGNTFRILYLSGTSGLGDDSGLFLNGDLILQKGAAVTASGFGPGTVYRGFLNVRCSASGNHAAVVVAVDDPTVPGAMETALLRLDVSGGAVTGQTLIARQGDVLAGQSRPVASIGCGRHQVAVNDNGDVLFFADLTGDPVTDGTIYLNGTLIAQEGGASPDAGRAYERLASRGLDLNNAGSMLFQADLVAPDTDDAVLVQDGTIPFREGATLLPAPFTSRTLVDFGSADAPVKLDDVGGATFAGDAQSNTSFLFAADTVLAVILLSHVESATVQSVIGSSGSLDVSSTSGWILFRVVASGIGGFVLASNTSAAAVDAPAVAAAAVSDLRVFPNPSPGTAQLRFALDRDGPVSVRVYDVRGRLVSTLADGVMPRGEHAMAWGGVDAHGARVAPGTYFVRLRAGGRERSARITLVE